MFFPSRIISGFFSGFLSFSIRPAISLRTVDFPLPDFPRIPSVFPFSISASKLTEKSHGDFQVLDMFFIEKYFVEFSAIFVPIFSFFEFYAKKIKHCGYEKHYASGSVRLPESVCA